jgi:predicted metal-dependent hydrolase
MLQVGERTVHYALKRSSRRTIGFTVDDRGLSITAPRWVTLADVEAAILEKQRWIFAKLGEWRHREARRVLPTVQWRDGASLPFLGQPITLQLDSPAGVLMFNAELRVLHLALPAHADEQQIKDRVQGWLQNQARRLLAERLDIYAAKLGVRHTGFALTSAATRWGSCTADGKIRLNWRLMHFPLSMIDYVAAHELAHLKEMNHGPRFWETVESIFPEFRDAAPSCARIHRNCCRRSDVPTVRGALVAHRAPCAQAPSTDTLHTWLSPTSGLVAPHAVVEPRIPKPVSA